MKTLDEVIKANECCDHGEPDSNCDECPYGALGACCAERESDALHYLKEYRDVEARRKSAIENLAKEYHEALLSYGLVYNPPLTWDELKQMEGKPVWVEDQFQNNVKKWCIVERIVKDEDCEYIIFDGLYFPKDYLGEKIDGWQAYRKER